MRRFGRHPAPLKRQDLIALLPIDSEFCCGAQLTS
jgi:hypothetical protein